MRLKRDDGTEIEIEYEIEEHGSPAVIGLPWESEPGEPTIVAITLAYDDEGESIVLPDAERERLELEIGQKIDENPADYYGED